MTKIILQPKKPAQSESIIIPADQTPAIITDGPNDYSIGPGGSYTCGGSKTITSRLSDANWTSPTKIPNRFTEGWNGGPTNGDVVKKLTYTTYWDSTYSTSETNLSRYLTVSGAWSTSYRPQLLKIDMERHLFFERADLPSNVAFGTTISVLTSDSIKVIDDISQGAVNLIALERRVIYIPLNFPDLTASAQDIVDISFFQAGNTYSIRIHEIEFLDSLDYLP